MPSFDVVSEVDKHELANAVDQANRELVKRFDFKGVEASFELQENAIELGAPSTFQLKQMQDILRGRLAARNIDARCLVEGDIQENVAGARQTLTAQQGIEQAQAKKLVALIKKEKFKVEVQINGDKLRVTGKKRDDLQAVMALLRKADCDQPLQFNNFRD